MKRHPYVGLPDTQFWTNDPGIETPGQFDPVGETPFKIGRADPVVTAGSCFAQHVARYLTKLGFNHHITEPAHPIFDDKTAQLFNYGAFSARYGNLYTARQLKQLLLRAYGLFEPIEQAWPRGDDGRVVDPFRPQIQPDGFVSDKELQADRRHHFAAIRRAVEDMSVFVFTLGLTECWADTRDGAVFPLAPGVAGGTYDPAIVEFLNFGLDETLDDLLFSLNFIREKNPGVRFIVTVSPVPLNATMVPRHVFVSTTWSKAVLRLAAEEAQNVFADCAYFPSYEIITSPHTRGLYFGPDRRAVTETGVAHVMRLFFKHFGDGTAAHPTAPQKRDQAAQQHMKQMEEIVEVLCDEEMISNR